jgi:CHAT domain-containing protein/Tfp pilus assembly protein PilF
VPQGASPAELRRQAEELERQGRHAQAEPLRRQVFEAFLKQHGQAHDQTLAAQTHLALCLDAIGKHDQAETHWRTLLDLCKQHSGEKSRPVADASGALGGCLNAQKKHAQAEPFFRKAIELRTELLGQEHVDVSIGYLSLAACLRQQNRLEEAEAAARQALAIAQKAAPENDRHAAHCHGVLVDVLNAARKYEQAEPLARRLVELWTRLEGDDDLEVASALAALGGSLFFQRRHDEAAVVFVRAWEIRIAALGEDHAITGISAQNYSDNLNALIAEAMAAAQKRHPNDPLALQIEIYERLLSVLEKCYPPDRYPDGHRRVARCQTQLGVLYGARGQLARARQLLAAALQTEERVLGARYPQGHAEIADVLSKLAQAMHAQGEYGEATKLGRRALEMFRRLYPPEVYPKGHPDLAAALAQMAFFSGGGREGCALYREALAMQRKLFPKEQYPHGHIELVETLNQLGNALVGIRQYHDAAECLDEALQMSRDLKLPATTLGQNLRYSAALYRALGNLPKAEERMFQAVEAYRQAYAPERYPLGHAMLALVLHDLGKVLYDQGRFELAAESIETAERMRYRLAMEFFTDVSEVEALNFAVHNLSVPSDLLSVAPAAGLTHDQVYEQVWQRRGIVHRVMSSRQRAWRARSAEVETLYRQYQAVRHALAQLALAPADPDPSRAAVQRQQREELSLQKEALERQLAAAVPEFQKELLAAPRGHEELAARLSPGEVFVDLLHYVYDPPWRGESPLAALKGLNRPTLCCVAFVVAPRRPVARVELGPAEPIHQAVAQWREAIANGSDRKAAAEVRKLLWAPLAAVLPDRMQAVYLAPDGALAAIPWAALPGDRPNSVLLEMHALATVPHGMFLLQELEGQPAGRPTAPGEDTLLAVGDVNFDRRSGAAAAPADVLASRAGEVVDKQYRWAALPGTRQELAAVAALAGERRVTVLRGAEASPGRVLEELPKARIAHLATHGFFADAKFRSLLQLDEGALDRSEFVVSGTRETLGGRNPLLLSGLALAGANPRPGEEPIGGILTAEGIAALPLPDLHLAVLSACETGRGNVAGGEGVFGLQRAFHQAGARNVVASLWKVDDTATAALMKLFYHNLWHKRLPPLAALRSAQLDLYHNPDRIAELAGLPPNELAQVKLRGIDVSQAAAGSGTPPSSPAAPRPKAETRLWAAFSLSGAGR